MTEGEKEKFNGGVELSLDIETMQNLKEELGINELEQIHRRFEDGTETLEDIMYHCLNYGLVFDGGERVRVVETKYFAKLVKYIEKQQKEIDFWKEDYNHRCQLAIDRKIELEKKDKIIDTAIKKIETLRQYFSEDLQPDFIGILEILKDKKVIDW